jgi:hypothetical protein
MVSYSPELQLADQWARRALALAHPARESYQSLRWLARIECALGHHREELRLARELVCLVPRDQGSLTCLLQAAKCNGLTVMEKQAVVPLVLIQNCTPKPVQPVPIRVRGRRPS